MDQPPSDSGRQAVWMIKNEEVGTFQDKWSDRGPIRKRLDKDFQPMAEIFSEVISLTLKPYVGE